MSKKATQLFVHIGPIREESQHIMQTAALPTFIATLEKKPSRLEALHNSLPELYVAECPISTEGGEAMLYEYNIAELSSIAPATGLKMLYPGLAEKQHRPAETHTLEAALKAHQLSDTPVTQLMIEQPEIAQPLLHALEAQGQLHALKKLWLRTSPESLYAEMPTQTELLATCEQLGFEVVNTQADDPDFLLVECKRNPLYHAHQRLQHKAAKLEQQHTEQTKALDAAKHELGELKQQQDQLKKARDEQTAAKETAQEEATQLKQAREKLAHQHAEQAKALDTAKHELGELKQQRDQLKKARDEQAVAKEKAQAENTQLKQEREKLAQQHAEQAKALDTAKQELDELQQQRDQFKKARDEQAACKEKAQTETAQLKLEREKLTQLHVEKDKALDVAKHELGELKQQHDQLKKARDEQAAAKEKNQAETAQLKQERDKLTKQQEALREQLREQQQKNQTLEAEVQATQTRQNKLTIELERAEAQLELIKELLLKDKFLQN